MNRLKILVVHLILLFIFLFLTFTIISGILIHTDINLNGKFSVGKYTEHKNIKKGYNDFFLFYINGVRYENIASGIKDEEGSYEKVGKFYKIRYSERFKGYLKAFIDKEVIDTTEILKAGFTMKDIITNKNDRININEPSVKQEVFAILGIKEE